MTYTAAEWDFMRRRLPKTYERLHAKHNGKVVDPVEKPKNGVKNVIINEQRLNILAKHTAGHALDENWQKAAFALEVIGECLAEVEEAHAKAVEHIALLEQGKRRNNARIIRSGLTEVSGMSWAKIINGGRKKEVCRVRQVGMYLMRQHTDLSYPAIGRMFGNRDHTTVLHATNKIRYQKDNHLDIIEPIRRAILKK